MFPVWDNGCIFETIIVCLRHEGCSWEQENVSIHEGILLGFDLNKDSLKMMMKMMTRMRGGIDTTMRQQPRDQENDESECKRNKFLSRTRPVLMIFWERYLNRDLDFAWKVWVGSSRCVTSLGHDLKPVSLMVSLVFRKNLLSRTKENSGQLTSVDWIAFNASLFTAAVTTEKLDYFLFICIWFEWQVVVILFAFTFGFSFSNRLVLFQSCRFSTSFRSWVGKVLEKRFRMISKWYIQSKGDYETSFWLFL